MNIALMQKQISRTSPRLKARIAGVFYLITFLTGILAFVNGRIVANIIATLAYLGVTVLFYDLFKPVNRNISLIAACFSLVGCALGGLNTFHLIPFYINGLVFFGIYCLVIGYLILRSTFLPHLLGVLMVFGGLGWLTFFSSPFANYLAPFNMIPGILGEGVLTLWLLVKGVDVQRWKQEAGLNFSSEPASDHRHD